MITSLDTLISRRSFLTGSVALVSLPALEAASRVAATSGRKVDQPTGTAKFLTLMQHVDRRMEELGVPSVGVAVVNADKRHTCALGISNVDDPQLVDAETMFRIGPLSQLFTGSAIGALVEDGALSLDASVGTYLSSLAKHQVSVEDLLTHRTGFHGNLTFDPGDDDDALRLYADEVATLGMVAPPGEYLNYGKTSGILVGRLIEEVTGLPFEIALRELTMAPLSMDHSSFASPNVRDLPTVTGHSRRGGVVTPIDLSNASRVTAPATGLFSNLNEVLHFVSFHAFATTPPTFVSAQTREMMHHAHGPGGSVGPVRVDAMGISWMISEFAGTQVSLLAGSDSGHSSMMAVVPSRKFGVVVLTNADFAQDLAIEITNFALELFCGIRPSRAMTMDRPPQELQRLAGTYSVAEGPTWRVTNELDTLRLETPEVSGALTFISPLTAMITTSDATLFVDFVLDSAGNIGWLRHMGQLAARAPA